MKGPKTFHYHNKSILFPPEKHHRAKVNHSINSPLSFPWIFIDLPTTSFEWSIINTQALWIGTDPLEHHSPPSKTTTSIHIRWKAWSTYNGISFQLSGCTRFQARIHHKINPVRSWAKCWTPINTICHHWRWHVRKGTRYTRIWTRQATELRFLFPAIQSFCSMKSPIRCATNGFISSHSHSAKTRQSLLLTQDTLYFRVPCKMRTLIPQVCI